MVIADFRFKVNQWRTCCTQEDLTPPPGTIVRLAVDPSYKASASADHSGLAAGYISEEYPKALTVLDAVSGRFKGIALPHRIVAMTQTWNVNEIIFEDPANGACDLLVDVLRLLMEPLGLTPTIRTFSPRKRFGGNSKALRIMELQTLLDANPPLIRIRYAASFIDHLFTQVENFIPEKKDNCTREDALLDAICFLGNIY